MIRTTRMGKGILNKCKNKKAGVTTIIIHNTIKFRVNILNRKLKFILFYNDGHNSH